ncbi:NAD(P)-binding protein [Corynespora cassiicola Philippines]|uniref:NAD(P)-binding protein n=1 Tax=Corynespora cassiicola Philippines TaxID=1448308 RepID=A0A2T2NB72_CORCC|nr:NAD(P)-binding protein [Corynespora cassiicola Philippines]
MSNKVLITGGNRGIGKALVAAFLSTPNTTVIATVRDLSAQSSLDALPKAAGSNVIVLKADVKYIDSINEAIKELSQKHGIDALDVVIANAGLPSFGTKLTEEKISNLREYIEVNSIGQVELYRALLPLLRASKSGAPPKYMYMSSAGGSLAYMQTLLPFAGYGASKALSNFYFKWFAAENPDVITWVQHPGVVIDEKLDDVATLKDLAGFDFTKMETLSLVDCASKLKKLIDEATPENRAGKFLGPDGEEIPW